MQSVEREQPGRPMRIRTLSGLQRVLTTMALAVTLAACSKTESTTAIPVSDAAPAADKQGSGALPNPTIGNVQHTDSASVPDPAEDQLAGAIRYTCESGAEILARYDEANDVIYLRYGGSRVTMQPAISASGARFVGGEWVWWGKGNEATLFALQPDGETGQVIENCAEHVESAQEE